MPRGDKDGSIKHKPAVIDEAGHVVTPEHWVIRKRYTDRKGRSHEKKRLSFKENSNHSIMRAIEREVENELAGLAVQRKTFAAAAKWYEERYLKPPEMFGESEIDGLRSWYKLLSPLKVLRAEFGEEWLDTIDYDRIDAFRIRYQHTPTRHGKPRMVHSVNRALELLRRLLTLAKSPSRKWILANPFDEGEPLIRKSEEVERMLVLSHEQEESILHYFAAQTEQVHRLAVIYAIDTAARPGEQFSTMKGHIQLKGRYIEITRGRAKMKRKRLVPITDRLRAGLVTRMRLVGDDELLFPFHRMRHAFKSACLAAGVPECRWQDLRHTGIMRMLDAGIDAATVMKITGHTSMVTFLRYVNLNPEIAGRVADARDAAQAERLQILAALETKRIAVDEEPDLVM